MASHFRLPAPAASYSRGRSAARLAPQAVATGPQQTTLPPQPRRNAAERKEVPMRTLYLPGEEPLESSARNPTFTKLPPRATPPQRNPNSVQQPPFSTRDGAQRSGGGNGAYTGRQPVIEVLPAKPVGRQASNGAARVVSAPEDGMSREADIVVVAEFVDADATPDLPLDTGFRWAQDGYSERRRAVEIWAGLAGLRARLWLLDQKWSYAGGFTETRKGERARSTAQWLRGAILDLGPTFIKLGQLFSTRSDLFPPEFTEELSQLQDRVPAFAASKAVAIIERELGAPLATLFAAFDERPLAAASLGQVHRARLHSGQQVVVKVQRPGLKALFEIDLAQLEKAAVQLDKGDEQRRDFKGIYAECATILRQEIDYISEGKNADRFRRNFRGVPWVQTPVVHWAYTSPRVITLSYLPGTKISDAARLRAAGLDTQLIARRATESYLTQVLKHGFLHSDPHPGNIAVSATGDLIFYDFGMMCETSSSRDRLMDVFFGIYQKDADKVVKALVVLGIIVPTSDLLPVRRSIAYFLDNFERQTESQETIGAIGEDMFAIAVDQPFRFPAAFTFVLRAFSTLEGLGKALDPDYKFADVARPYALELLELEGAEAQRGFFLETLQAEAQRSVAAAAAMPGTVATAGATLAALEAGDLKLRVRVLESERADRRQGVLQLTTVNAVAVAGAANIATQLALAGQTGGAAAVAVAAGGFGFLVWRGFKRVKRLDDFEDKIKG